MSNDTTNAPASAGPVLSDGLGLCPARAMADAPLDGTLVQLLVRFDSHAMEDTTDPTWTIGSHNDGEWHFVGWDWHRDEWTRGSGDLLGWLPMGMNAPERASRAAVRLGEGLGGW